MSLILSVSFICIFKPDSAEHNLHLLLTNLATYCVKGNVKPDRSVWPEVVRAIQKSEGFVFPLIDRVTCSVNKLKHGTTFFQRLKNNLAYNVYMCLHT